MYKDVCFDMYVYVCFFQLITVLCICMYGLCPCACVAYDLIKVMLMLLCTASRAKNLESSLNWTFRLVLWVSGLERLHIHSPRPYDREQACSCNQSNVASKFFLTSSEYVSIWLKHFFAVAFHSLSPQFKYLSIYHRLCESGGEKTKQPLLILLEIVYGK